MDKCPLVSICSITYNHALYIRQCLDSMLMQQTSFKFEIIINDDCSTDGTTEILREYEAKYPEIVHPVYHKENLYQKGQRGFFNKFVFPKTRGKYMALCEGDDYWTDPLKLQKQVDFLEEHPDYALCFHNATVHYEGKEAQDHLFADLQSKEYDKQTLLKSWLAPTASFILRKSVLNSSYYQQVMLSKKLAYGDLPLLLSASYCGKIFGMSEPMSVYRKHIGGVMQTHTSIPIKLCTHQIECKRIFENDVKPIFNDLIGRHASIAMSWMRHKSMPTAFKLWWLAFRNAPIDSIKWTFLYFKKGIKQNRL